MKQLFSEEVKTVVSKPGIYYLKFRGKDYVGSSISLKDRLYQHRQNLIANKHYNVWMQNIYNKYGEKDCYFSILEVLDSNSTQLEILECEKKWIDTLGPVLNFKLDPVTQNNSINQSKKVYQYTLDGKLIAEFPSTKEAERQTGVNSTLVSACARRQLLQAKGYFWSYEPVPNYQYSLERSKWKWKAIILKNIKTGKTEVFNNISQAVRSIIKEGDNFDSMCATLSAIAKRGRGTLKYTYTCFYLDDDNAAALKLGELLENPEMDNQQPS